MVDKWEEPDSGQFVVLTFDDGYRDTFTTAFSRLREMVMSFSRLCGYTYRRDEHIFGTGKGGCGAESWYMVEKMLESGLMTLGVHTHTQRDPRHLGPSEVEEEISTNNELIRKRIGVESRRFAYPWGYWYVVARPLLQERHATAVLRGSPNPERRPSPDRLHRCPVRLSGGVALFKLESGAVSDSKRTLIYPDVSGTRGGEANGWIADWSAGMSTNLAPFQQAELLPFDVLTDEEMSTLLASA